MLGSLGVSVIAAWDRGAGVCVLAGVIADAEPITAIVGRRGEAGGRTWEIVVSEFGDGGAQGSVVGEKFSFAGFEFADSAVGLVELVVE